MQSRVIQLNCSTRTVEPGSSVQATCSTVKSIGPIYFEGDSCTVYTNNSEIRGNCNTVYGDGNTVFGNMNMTYGSGNSVTGNLNENKPNQNCATTFVRFKEGVPWVVHTNNNNLIGSVNIFTQTGDEPQKKESKYPTKEEAKHDQKVKDGDDDSACVICLENKKICVIRPCKHLCLCATCSSAEKALEQCPVCRVSITCIERLY